MSLHIGLVTLNSWQNEGGEEERLECVYRRGWRLSVARRGRDVHPHRLHGRLHLHRLHRRAHGALVRRAGAGRPAVRRTEERGHSSAVDGPSRFCRRVQLVRDVLTQLQRLQPQPVLQLEPQLHLD